MHQHEHAIRVRGLCKSFGDHLVLDRLDLEVPAGSIFALLGPNGSGKTTTVNLLTTLLRSDDGAIEVAGHDVAVDPADVRAVIGVTGQFSAVDDLLTGRENLRLVADLCHLPRAMSELRLAELLERFDLVDAADRAASIYSGGMRRRLDLAMTLLGRPQVLFLDEPTAGLDPRSRRQVWDHVRSLVAGGVTVFLTTQYLDEADALADRIAVLDGGRLVAEGTPAQLKAFVPGGQVSFDFAELSALAAATSALSDWNGAADIGTLTLRIPAEATVGTLRRLLAAPEVTDETRIEVAQPELDDVFFALTEVVR
jgi:ABC-2 type transport system ATP-binding protein